MQFVELTPKEYNLFINSKFKQYTQSLEHYNSRKNSGKRVYLLGVKSDEGTVLAAGLFTSAKVLKFWNYVYSHRGPVMDYDNIKLMEFYFLNIRKYFKKRKSIFILIDPYVIQSVRNHKGEIEFEYENSKWMACISRLGFKHSGFSTGYSDLSQARWLSVLNLDVKSEEMILKNMEYNTSHSIKKALEMGVKVRDLSLEEIDKFYKLYRKAEVKHGFSLFNQNYFVDFLKSYPTMTFLKMAYIDLRENKKILKEKLTHIEQEINTLKSLSPRPMSKKRKNKLKELEIILNKVNRDFDEANLLQNKYGNYLELASAIFAKNNNELVYLYSGSDSEFNKFMGNYVLQWEMIKFAKANKLARYNFYGITGVFTKEAQDYGVLKFKKGFGGYVEELIGDFICITNPFAYYIYKLKNCIKR
ncbi:peptidoglycan bridge formation glycyltransferase FemA/FemB family protein [Staphylococcus agnetis]|uniref:peptidoglycan bridge formation glycyltransferase FemA/FemB family protein n=1 Tax=Staphylococcus agnetis TaxID=985762 RepID=UPI0015C4E254|nr:peptidoglycan bridge formation glycyltransferase FemA/FemB family protein [Staphylococcus agnetis]MDG4943917.1 peptidoglycan bridge formation glycyltransferase FemA/FemB family protein [Staphylococcus agnetis]